MPVYFPGQTIVSGRQDTGTVVSNFTTSFSPPNIAGLRVWLKSGDVSGGDGAAVATWPDASGNGNDATQPIGLNQPVKKISIVNGQDVVRFDGVSSELNTILNRPSATSLFIVTFCSDPGGGGPRMINYGSADCLGPFGTGPSWGYYADSGVAVQTLGGILASWTLISLTENVAAAEAYLNGILAASFTTFNSPTAPLSLGHTSGGTYYSGDIAEVIVYDSVLSALDRVRVESYLMDKYAL